MSKGVEMRVLISDARSYPSAARDGLSLADLADLLVATNNETHDAVRALEPGIAWLWPSRDWRCRLRFDRELRLLTAANDNAPHILNAA
jgi:hypothetical protein